MNIRWTIRRDLPAVLAIDRASFAAPWSEARFVEHLKIRNCIGMVAECDGEIVGHVVYELHRRHVSVVRLAVAPAFRRRGIGREILQCIENKLDVTRRTEIWLELGERDLRGQLFVRACGMRCCQTLHVEGRDDLYLFKRRPFAERIRPEDAAWVGQVGGLA